MYELADWGTPVAPADMVPRERVTLSLPSSVARVLRSRAHAQGLTLEALVGRLVDEALAPRDVLSFAGD